MKRFTFKMFLLACFVFAASYSNAQFKFTSNTNIGQTLSTDSVKGTQTFLVDYSTAIKGSTWVYTDSTKTKVTFTLGKCQTQKGLQVNIYAADTANAPKIINGDFECRDYGANRNPARVASVDSLLKILRKYEIQNAGTADSVKNVTWKPSACLFDLDASGTNQAFGAHPGMYKVIEYGFQYSFAGFSVTNADIMFDISTLDAGNTTKTASYTLKVGIGSATSGLIEVPGFYVTGSGKKTVKLAAAIGKTPSDFSNKKIYFFLKTSGTGTPMAKGTVDPTIVIDNMVVTYQMPSWVSPNAGIKANSILNNMSNPLLGNLNKETKFGILLQTKGRIGTFKVVNDLQDPTKQYFTFLDSMAVMAKDASGKYTVKVPYVYTPGVYNAGTMTWSKAAIEVAAPATGSANDDVMFYFKATPTSKDAMSTRLELNCGTRIWYDVYFKGADVIDLSGINNSTILLDTLPDVPDGAVILLKPGMTYNTGATTYEFNKSVEIRSADPTQEMPVFDCVKNFNVAEGSNISSIVFRNIKFVGDYANQYAFNIDKSATVGEIKFESCKIHKLRGGVRVKSGTGTLNKFTIIDCVVDSIKDYGVLAMDVNTWVCNDILIKNSTISRAIMLFTSRNNSNSVMIENCTISEGPEKGRQMFRWREAGKDNVLNGITIKNTIWGHGWNTTGDNKDVLLDGFDGLGATTWTIVNSYATSDFGYAAGKDSIPGFPGGMVTKSAAELWVAPYSMNFNIADANFAGVGKVGDPRWVLSPGTSVKQITSETADVMVYPNPAKDYAKVRFTLTESANGSLSLYNMLGQKIEISSNEQFNVGVNEISINTQSLNVGMYIYVLQAGDKLYKGKLNIAK